MTEGSETRFHVRELGDLSPPPALAVDLARYARSQGRLDEALQLVQNSLRNGGWQQPKLWYELVSLMNDPSDYSMVRQTWWSSPRECHEHVSIMRAVARAACIAGQHDEARVLLKKAILHQSRAGSASPIRALRQKIARSDGQAVKKSRGARSFQARAALALRDLDMAFSEIGVRSFIISGTLLGYVRDGAIIPWDKDIDLGIFSAAIEAGDLEHEFAQQEAFSVRRVDLSSDRLRITHRNGVWVDVFPHYMGDDGRIWHDGSATRWWNTPFELKEVEFLRLQVKVPDPPERYLDENYGNWRRPDSNFDARLDAPNVEVIDPAHLETLHFFSLLDSIRSGNSDKKERYSRLLRRLGEDEWLDRL